MNTLRNNDVKPIASIIEDQLRFFSSALVKLNKLAGTYPPIVDPDSIEKPINKLLEETVQDTTEYLSVVHFQFCQAISIKMADCSDKDLINKYNALCFELEKEKIKILDAADELTALRHKHGENLNKQHVKKTVGKIINLLDRHQKLEISLKKQYNQAMQHDIKRKSQAILKIKNPATGLGPKR